MKTRYVVSIDVKVGNKVEARYVRVTGSGRFSYDVGLVKKKSAASRFDTQAIAEVFSSWFWEHRWDRATYQSREVEPIKVRESV